MLLFDLLVTEMDLDVTGCFMLVDTLHFGWILSLGAAECN